MSWRLLACVLAACGTDGPPTCAANTVQLDGTVGGTAVHQSGAPTSYAFNNAFGPTHGAVSIGFGDSGVVDLAWADLVADDHTTAANGSLLLSTSSPYCIKAATLTPKTDAEGGGVSFSLTTLTSGACPGTPIDGSVEGCAAPGAAPN